MNVSKVTEILYLMQTGRVETYLQLQYNIRKFSSYYICNISRIDISRNVTTITTTTKKSKIV